VGEQKMQSNSVRSAYLIFSGLVMTLPTTALAAGGKSATGLEEVTVTARRREESAQETPIAVSVLSAEQLYTAGIKELRDLTSAVPGVNITVSGAGNNTVFSVRGRSRAVVGNAQPSVTAYVNEVPLPVWGASIPTYDVSSIQVLKGPQGTLFGRNSTTGAVLVSTAQPTHNLEGYLQATLGNYQFQQYEGAINLPLLQDKIALRVSGQTADRNGYTKNMSQPGHDFDNLNRQNYRLSLLIEPFDGLKNVTVYERNDQDEVGAGIVLNERTDGVIDAVPYYNGTYLGFLPSAPFVVLCNGNPMCDISAATARQNAAGPRKAWTSIKDAYYKGKQTAWSNTTTFDVGSVTLKNIFGYREVYFHNLLDVDGTDTPMIDADNLVDLKQTTEEFQASGKAFNDTLDYIAGYFYSDGAPNGANRLPLQLFAAPGAPINSTLPAPYNGAYGSGDYYHDTSNAFFGQLGYKLGGISDSLSAFSIDLGVRTTKDEQSVCSAGNLILGNIYPQSVAQPAITESDCKAGQGTQSKTDSQKTTYTFGINYQLASNVLVYGVTRTGYRTGGINTPKLAANFAQYQTYEPEEVTDYELGLKSDWTYADMAGRFNVAVFESKYDKIQAGIAVPPNIDGDNNSSNDSANSTLMLNAGKATVKGIEAEATLIPFDHLELSVSGAYLDNQIDSISSAFPVSEEAIKSFVFLASPRYSYNLGTTYTLPLADLGDVRFGAKYFRISDVQYGSVLSSGYERTDLRADWLNIAQSGIDVGAFINNVFDKAAIVAPGSSSAGLGTNSGIYNEPRMYGVQARYHFGNK
jgi:iron complex outermembrane recepter protein